jgi:hypothetical protein
MLPIVTGLSASAVSHRIAYVADRDCRPTALSRAEPSLADAPVDLWRMWVTTGFAQIS